MRIVSFAALAFFISAPQGARGQSFPPPQQAPIGDATVAVPAGASTLIWTTNLSARVVRIVPPYNNPTCAMQCDASAAATANSTPIPGGYVFNLTEPPPKFSCYAYCTTAGSIVVSQGN